MEKEKRKKSILKRLTETNDIRIEEELTRPRVEVFVDEYSAWVASHRKCKECVDFTNFGIGYH